MKRFLVDHYNATGFTTPTSSAVFNNLEATYRLPSNLIRTHYEDNISETISSYYTSPASSLILLTGDLLLPSFGLYYFKLVASGGTAEILIEDVVIATTLLTNGEGSVTLPNGVKAIKVRFIGDTTTGSYTLTWKAPGQGSFSSIPISSRPMYGNTLFPFEVFEEVSQTIRAQYEVLGADYQKQKYVTDAEPSKSFEVILAQNTVEDRVLVKNWFMSVKGKYKPFLFHARNNAFSLDETPVSGNQFILVKKAYTAITYGYISKILYFPEADFASQIASVEEYVNMSGESCEKLYLYDTIPVFNTETVCREVNFLYYCRLDTDTLTFELKDINFSSVKLSIVELYNDYNTISIV